MLPSTQNSPIMATLLTRSESARYKDSLSCCPFHVVPRQHSIYHIISFHRNKMCVCYFYEYKRKHPHKCWQDESLSWLVSLGEEKERGKKTARPLTWHLNRDRGIFYLHKSLSLNSSLYPVGQSAGTPFTSKLPTIVWMLTGR